MGMEVNGVAAASSYQSQNLQAAKPVSQVSSVTTTTDKSNEMCIRDRCIQEMDILHGQQLQKA